LTKQRRLSAREKKSKQLDVPDLRFGTQGNLVGHTPICISRHASGYGYLAYGTFQSVTTRPVRSNFGKSFVLISANDINRITEDYTRVSNVHVRLLAKQLVQLKHLDTYDADWLKSKFSSMPLCYTSLFDVYKIHKTVASTLQLGGGWLPRVYQDLPIRAHGMSGLSFRFHNANFKDLMQLVDYYQLGNYNYYDESKKCLYIRHNDLLSKPLPAGYIKITENAMYNYLGHIKDSKEQST